MEQCLDAIVIWPIGCVCVCVCVGVPNDLVCRVIVLLILHLTQGDRLLCIVVAQEHSQHIRGSTWHS